MNSSERRRFHAPGNLHFKVAILLWLLISAAPPAGAQFDASAVRESVVQIAVMDGDEVERLGSGVVVTDAGHVLTAAHLVEGEDLVTVIPVTTKAQLVARVDALDERADLALLVVTGMTVPPIRFARDGFEPGRQVFSTGLWDSSDSPMFLPEVDGDPRLPVEAGAVGRLERYTRGADAISLLEHNAMISAAGYGGPLLNECGELAGLNRGAPELSVRQLRSGRGPDQVVYSLHPAEIIEFLSRRAIGVVVSETTCLTALEREQVERARVEQQLEDTRRQEEAARSELEQTRRQEEVTRSELDRTRRQGEAARAELDESRRREEATRTQLQQATLQAENAQTLVENLEAEREAAVRAGEEVREGLLADLEAARQEQQAAAERVSAIQAEEEIAAGRRRTTVIVVTGAGFLAALTVFLVYRRRSRQLASARLAAEDAEQKAAEAVKRATRSIPPDYTLTGETGEGRSVSLQIPGALLTGDGAVVGRSPQAANLVVNDRTVSRRHARLSATGESLFVEDLDATNGTQVNGEAVYPGAKAAVRDGDVIDFGAVSVQVKRIGAPRSSGPDPPMEEPIPQSAENGGTPEPSYPESEAPERDGGRIAGPARGIRRGTASPEAGELEPDRVDEP